jgi:hypothetical protein
MKKQADFLLPLKKAGRFQKVGRFSMVITVLPYSTYEYVHVPRYINIVLGTSSLDLLDGG